AAARARERARADPHDDEALGEIAGTEPAADPVHATRGFPPSVSPASTKKGAGPDAAPPLASTPSALPGGLHAELVAHGAHAGDGTGRERRLDALLLAVDRTRETGDAVLHVDVDVRSLEIAPGVELMLDPILQLVVVRLDRLLLGAGDDLELVHDA